MRNACDISIFRNPLPVLLCLCKACCARGSAEEGVASLCFFCITQSVSTKTIETEESSERREKKGSVRVQQLGSFVGATSRRSSATRKGAYCEIKRGCAVGLSSASSCLVYMPALIPSPRSPFHRPAFSSAFPAFFGYHPPHSQFLRESKRDRTQRIQ